MTDSQVELICGTAIVIATIAAITLMVIFGGRRR